MNECFKCKCMINEDRLYCDACLYKTQFDS